MSKQQPGYDTNSRCTELLPGYEKYDFGEKFEFVGRKNEKSIRQSKKLRSIA